MNRRFWGCAILATFAILNCSGQAPSDAQQKKELPIARLDTYLARLNVSAQRIKAAPTSILRQDAVKQVTEEAQKLISAVRIEALVTIRDVRMRNDDTASISIKDLHLPSLPPAKDMAFGISLNGAVNLPMSAEQARAIRPGQKLLLRGPAAYRGGSHVELVFSGSSAFVRLSFSHAPSYRAFITLVPEHFTILKQ